jgi:predicted alpha/beta superfamily hydrolase
MKYTLLILLLCSAVVGKAQQEAPVIVGHSVNLHSKVLNEDRTILIYLPEGYKGSTAAYPVVYLMDAETHWFHTGSSAAFLSLLGKMPKSIIIGVVNTDRARDMTPHPVVPDKDFPSGGGSVKFLAFINEELKPYVVSHYRTDPFTVLAGTSLSGLFVINSFISQPHAFNAYIAASPSMWWDKRAVAYKAEQMLKTPIYSNRFIFFSLCDGDSPELQASTQYFMKALKTRTADSLHWQYLYIPGEDHNSSPLKSFYTGFQWLYTDWAGENINTMAALKLHYRMLSKKYAYTIAIPETDINNLGYSLLFSENKLQAIPVFRMNTEKYPASANAWDSLGDAYKINNQLDSAKMAYEKGCAIAKQTNNINTPGMCSNLAEVTKMIREKTGKKQ